MTTYDLIVIGSGPGGYVCAIRAAQLGLKTALIEKYNTLGGTCLNVGCIPSKALLDSSEHYYNAKHAFASHGIGLSALTVDLPKMIERKANVVKDNVNGIAFLMKKNKIAVYHGLGSFVDANTISVQKADGSHEQLSGKKIVIATGSKPSKLPGIEIDKKRIITSTEALNLQEIPKHMVIIGGGVIGLELGSVYARLGAKITVIEYTDTLIGSMDAAMGKELQKVLSKLGFEFYLSHQVLKTTNTGNSVTVEALNRKTNESIEIKSDYCLVSIGRSPYTQGLALENAGLKTDERGRISVNNHLQTQVPHIFAIGDVVQGAMLAHKAEEEGTFVAEYIVGEKPHINYLCIPNVVYTWPEVASVGHTEAGLKQLQIPYKTGQFPFKASGRARASGDLDGLVRVYAHQDTDEILGVHMIGPRVADMIAEAVLAMEFRASAEDIARISHAHPTYTEVFREACLAATANRAIHI